MRELELEAVPYDTGPRGVGGVGHDVQLEVAPAEAAAHGTERVAIERRDELGTQVASEQMEPRIGASLQPQPTEGVIRVRSPPAHHCTALTTEAAKESPTLSQCRRYRSGGWTWTSRRPPSRPSRRCSTRPSRTRRPSGSARSRTRYVVAHGALRTVLAHVAGGAPEAVVIDRTCRHCGHARHGRPTLAGSDVEFNLSHSEGIALIACTRSVRVGVDVEVVQPRSLLPKLARGVLDDATYETWLALPESEQLGAFVQEWTAREAYLKGVGLGVVRRMRDIPASPPGWTISALPVEDTARASLAVEHHDPPEVRLANWTLAGAGTLGQ